MNAGDGATTEQRTGINRPGGRERKMQGFKSAGSAQRFLSVNLQHLQRPAPPARARSGTPTRRACARSKNNANQLAGRADRKRKSAVRRLAHKRTMSRRNATGCSRALVLAFRSCWLQLSNIAPLYGAYRALMNLALTLRVCEILVAHARAI
jgi:hypothetical protein